MTLNSRDTFNTGITTLLQTKLHQPHATRQRVLRPRLRERLDQGLGGPLIGVAAAADGFQSGAYRVVRGTGARSA